MTQKILADAALIVGDKRGRRVWYSAVPQRLGQFACMSISPTMMAVRTTSRRLGSAWSTVFSRC